MLSTILFILCIFVSIWNGIIFVGCAISKSLATGFPAMNILLWAITLTGIVTHVIGIW